MASEPRRVAAFDFDGTISRRDTLVPFLARVAGRPRLAAAAARRAPQLVAMNLGRADRDLEKEHLLRRTLVGARADRVSEVGETYAAALWNRHNFRPEILDRLAWHRSEHHEIVIVSASLEVYLEPLAPHLGVDHVIACQLETAGHHLTGELLGGNVRGAEKTKRLRAWLGDATVELWAYGDSSGDNELLAMADHPTRV
ncbi:MAG: HAD-IB family hydrolase [Acidimicrobiia bacterium]|nr:HAD-IB family hydrolase [Acidimicrobiia bacterium]